MKKTTGFNVLILGCGGREIAIMEAIYKSPLAGNIYINPIHESIKDKAKNIPDISSHSDFISIAKSCKQYDIDLVVPGSETFFAAGLVDFLKQEKINVFGPTKASAKLESSKVFTKELCSKYKIPTAKYAFFSEPDAAKAYAESLHWKVAIKADGIALGKGVYVCHSKEEAEKAINDMLIDKKFGAAGELVIVEELLNGYEVSAFFLINGPNIIPLGAAQDYKTIKYDDKSYNTGGMGAFSPVENFTPDLLNKVMETIIYPTVRGMHNLHATFNGVLFAGLMIGKDKKPKLLEYNVRFGDPETQCILPLLETDFLSLLINASNNSLENKPVSFFKNKASVCVVMASRGYPNAYKTGEKIMGLENKPADVELYHAGTELNENGNWVNVGGRVLNIVATGSNREDARHKAYAAIDSINCENLVFRYDIGDTQKDGSTN